MRIPARSSHARATSSRKPTPAAVRPLASRALEPGRARRGPRPLGPESHPRHLVEEVVARPEFLALHTEALRLLDTSLAEHGLSQVGRNRRAVGMHAHPLEHLVALAQHLLAVLPIPSPGAHVPDTGRRPGVHDLLAELVDVMPPRVGAFERAVELAEASPHVRPDVRREPLHLGHVAQPGREVVGETKPSSTVTGP